MDRYGTMKCIRRLLIIFLCLMLGFRAGYAAAAEWPAGTGPAQPYPGRPAADLEHSLGDMMLYPCLEAPAQHYCDSLYMFLPREDMHLPDAHARDEYGLLYVYNGNGELLEIIDASDRSRVTMEIIPDKWLQSLLWGGGVMVRLRLLTSLVRDQSYYVEMQPGIILTPGLISNPAVHGPETWQPRMTGSYGISGRRYRKAPETDLSLVGPDTVQQKPPDAHTTAVVDQTRAWNDPDLVIRPEKGDRIDMDVFLGGDAVTAVIYCPEWSYYFEQTEYTVRDADPETGLIHVTGRQTADTPGNLGVIFLDSEDNWVNILMLSGESPVRE